MFLAVPTSASVRLSLLPWRVSSQEFLGQQKSTEKKTSPDGDRRPVDSGTTRGHSLSLEPRKKPGLTFHYTALFIGILIMLIIIPI